MRFMHREWEEAEEVEEDVKNDYKEEHVKNDYKEEHVDDKRRKRNQEVGYCSDEIEEVRSEPNTKYM